ncbi:hypothetical protein GOV08_01920 [Candidatus Woesearchaeota archaeon]|nr:hypothetical protein [Candidatus Woesearchaeota archaeon]
MKKTQIVAAVFIAILVLNFLLFVFGVYKQDVFWVVILVSFVASYAIKKIENE